MQKRNALAPSPASGNGCNWAFDDPAAVEGTDEDKLRKFRQVRDQIDRRIRDWIKELA